MLALFSTKVFPIENNAAILTPLSFFFIFIISIFLFLFVHFFFIP